MRPPPHLLLPLSSSSSPLSSHSFPHYCERGRNRREGERLKPKRLFGAKHLHNDKNIQCGKIFSKIFQHIRKFKPRTTAENQDTLWSLKKGEQLLQLIIILWLKPNIIQCNIAIRHKMNVTYRIVLNDESLNCL